MYYFRLYIEFIKLRFQEMAEYRNVTIWTALCQATGYSTEFILIWVMINQFKTIGGWGPYEVMFLYALNLISYSVAGSFLYRTCTRLPGMVQNGTFDDVLIKPTNPLLYLTCNGFLYGYFSHITVSIIIITICFSHLGITFTFAKLLFLIVTILSGALIQGAAFLFTSVPCFWLIQSSSLGGFMGSLRGFIRYPLSAYNKIVQIALTLIVPYAFVNFYPAQIFLNKNDFLMFGPMVQYLSPLVGITVFILAYKFWTAGIRHYKSTGS